MPDKRKHLHGAEEKKFLMAGCRKIQFTLPSEVLMLVNVLI